MPYKVSGTNVMVQRNGKWVLFKKHKTHAEAVAQVQAIEISLHKQKNKKHK
jgi:hypothetical protein